MQHAERKGAAPLAAHPTSAPPRRVAAPRIRAAGASPRFRRARATDRSLARCESGSRFESWVRLESRTGAALIGARLARRALATFAARCATSSLGLFVPPARHSTTSARSFVVHTGPLFPRFRPARCVQGTRERRAAPPASRALQAAGNRRPAVRWRRLAGCSGVNERHDSRTRARTARRTALCRKCLGVWDLETQAAAGQQAGGVCGQVRR